MKQIQFLSARYDQWCIAPFLFYVACFCGCFSAESGTDRAVTGQQTVKNRPKTETSNTASDSITAVESAPVSKPISSPAKSRSRSGLPQFKEIARQLGIRFQTFNDEVPSRYFLPEVMGAGIAWIDFDRDGWLDLFLANGCALDGPVDDSHHCQFYRNHFGQSFSEVTTDSKTGVVLFGQGCAVGDYDSDGFSDLFIGGYGSDILLKNNGDGTFQDVTAIAKVSDPRWSTSSLWIDLDGDELLDLFVVNYCDVSLKKHRICNYAMGQGYCGPGTFDAQEDCVYRNLGDGTFEETATKWGLNSDNGKGLAAIAADFDWDLVPEIYVANDMTANFMFAKDNAGRTQSLYREVASESGCAVSGAGMNEASMGVAVADFNCDALPDIFLTHYYHAKNTLYRNLGKRLFEDDSYHSKVAAPSTESLGFGVVVIDYNRDGSPDLFIATGHVLGPEQQPQKMTPQLLQNLCGVVVDVSADAGDYFRVPGIARCAAAADFDNDGDLDIAVSQVGSPFSLLRNDTIVSERPFVGLKLATSNRIPPTGGRVICRVNGREVVTPVVAGGSYLAAADDRIILAGWDESEGEPQIEIYWPSGRIDRIDHLPKNRYTQIHEEGSRTELVK